MEQSRLDYLIKLKQHCENSGQRFTNNNVRELADLLLTQANYAENTHRDGNSKQK